MKMKMSLRGKCPHFIMLREFGKHKPQSWVTFHHPRQPEGFAAQSFISLRSRASRLRIIQPPAPNPTIQPTDLLLLHQAGKWQEKHSRITCVEGCFASCS